MSVDSRGDRRYNFYIGLDLSLTGTGIVVLDKDGNMVENLLISTFHKDPVDKKTIITTEQRLIIIKDKVLEICNKYENIKIGMEGLSYGSRGESMLELAALHYFLKVNFLTSKFQYDTIQPSAVKKHITGVGNCKKELMLLKVYKKYGVEFDDNNLCDAFGLAKFIFERE